MEHAHASGRSGEDVAAATLEGEGWVIVARNYRKGPGELDLVAFRRGLLAFVEVKAWARYGAGELEHAINRRKRARIVETSKIFLAANRQYRQARIRYDVLLVSGGAVAGRYEAAFGGSGEL
jgi:putative endonuclease